MMDAIESKETGVENDELNQVKVYRIYTIEVSEK